VSSCPFYGPEQAGIHHREFGGLAANAAARLLGLLEEHGLRQGTVVDLGCGSGILAKIVSEAGYEVLGVDISADMLALAAVSAPAARCRQGSLLDAELPPAVAVTAIGEALNYATDPRAGLAQLELLARRIRGSLGRGGVLLFDVATPGRNGPVPVYQQWEDHDGWTLYMRAEESADRARLDRRITIFTRDADGRYRRVDEHHVLVLYPVDTVLALLRGAGFGATVESRYGPTDPSIPGWAVIVATPAT
jgi:SAM-dependent methyltransferase